MAEKWVGNLRVDWDEEVDVLYIAIDKPEAAITHEERDEVLFRHRPLPLMVKTRQESNGLLVDHTHDGRIVGATVLDYEKKFRKLADVSWLETLDFTLPQELLEYLKNRPEPPK